MTQNAPRIIAIDKQGLAAELGWSINDRILEINGHPIEDMLDLLYYEQEETIDVTVVKADGKPERWLIDKDPEETLGIELESLDLSLCHNNCVFCFVHQQPKGLRSTLYVKDEDYRFSFLHGNFVTLSHITQAEIEKIERLHLSPLYVSVHATDEQARQRLLGHAAPNPIMPLLKRLVSSNITLHAQIVLCPGYNDGTVLDRTIDDLISLTPGVASLALVPVGLTRHRRNLPVLAPVTPERAARLVKKYTSIRAMLIERFGFPWLYLADEFFILAGRSFPGTKYYADFPQIENGVGLCRQFIDAWHKARRKLKSAASEHSFALITGRAFAPILNKLVHSTFPENSDRFRIIPIVNTLFGESITVTGLLSGNDIITQCRQQNLTGTILIPD
ncbi:DUF512 domain-containing protein, partial [bacterium]|nr:DUF512 domain-containing protein [bacterium]